MNDVEVYLAGICLAVLISCINSVGMGLQKKVHKQIAEANANSPNATRKSYVRHKMWLAGLLCMASASGLVLFNFAILGQSRASAMASITIVTNLIMSRYLLKEELTRIDLLSSAFIMTGIIVAVIFGAAAGGASVTSLEGIRVILSRNTVYIASACVVVIVILLEIFIRRTENLGLNKSHSRALAECVARALLAGVFSGATGFFSKGFVLGIKQMVAPGSDGSVFKMPIFYVFLIFLPITTAWQLKCLNSALANFDSLLVVPIYQASICIIGVVWGWIFYAENKELPALNQGMFITGCLISVFGICLLGLKPRRPHAPPGTVMDADLPPEISRTISLAREASMTLKSARSLRSLSISSQESQTTHFLAASRPLATSMNAELLSTDPTLFTNDEPIVVVDGASHSPENPGPGPHPKAGPLVGNEKISAGLQDVANAITESTQSGQSVHSAHSAHSAREKQISPHGDRRTRRNRPDTPGTSVSTTSTTRYPAAGTDSVEYAAVERESFSEEMPDAEFLPGSPEPREEDTYYAAEGDSEGGGFRLLKKPGAGANVRMGSIFTSGSGFTGGEKTNRVVNINGVKALYDPTEAWG